MSKQTKGALLSTPLISAGAPAHLLPPAAPHGKKSPSGAPGEVTREAMSQRIRFFWDSTKVRDLVPGTQPEEAYNWGGTKAGSVTLAHF